MLDDMFSYVKESPWHLCICKGDSFALPPLHCIIASNIMMKSRIMKFPVSGTGQPSALKDVPIANQTVRTMPAPTTNWLVSVGLATTALTDMTVTANDARTAMASNHHGPWSTTFGCGTDCAMSFSPLTQRAFPLSVS